jgi:hypothetical protein
LRMVVGRQGCVAFFLEFFDLRFDGGLIHSFHRVMLMR